MSTLANPERSPSICCASSPPHARPQPRAWNLQHLPPFAPVALRLLKLVSKEAASLREISDLLATDPGLSQDVIRLANSPLVGTRYEIAGVLHALAMLGMERVKGLVTTVALRDFLAPVRGCSMFLPCWRHTLACALFAEKLSRPLSLNPDRTYTAGLLHEIGRLAFLAVYPEEYSALLHRSIEEQCDARPWEKQAFGLDWMELGRELAGRWKLPKGIAAAILMEESPGDEQFGVPQLVSLCCRLADLSGFQVDGMPLPQGLEEIAAQLPAWAGECLQPGLENTVIEVVTQINALECSLLS